MRLLAAAVLLLVAFAGCNDDGAKDEVIVLSGNVVNATDAPATPPTGKGLGHIAGFVVDDTIRPVKNATVRLPALDLEDMTDRNGKFEFVDLAPGDHIIRINATGHQDAEAILEVKKDRFTRAKVILHAIPPPEPYREFVEFQGYADVTDHGTFLTGLGLLCYPCSWSHEPGRNATAVVLEAVMEPYIGSTSGRNGFHLNVGPDFMYGQPNPLWHTPEDIDAILDIDITPYGDPLPETNKAFEVFITTFYNEPVPAGFSVVEGNT